MHKNKITSLEWVCILLSGSLFTALSYSHYTAVRVNILMLALSQAAAVILLLLIIIPLKKYYQKYDSGIIIQTKSGNSVVNTFCTAVYSFYYMYASAVTIIIGTLFVKAYVDNHIIIPVFVAVIALCGYISAVRGIHSAAGSTVMLTLLSLAAVVFIFMSLIFRAEPLNFSYALSYDFSGIDEATAFSASGGLLLPCMLIFRKDTENKALKGLNIWIVLSFVVCSSIAVMTYAVSGEYSNYTMFPFYTSAQLLEAGSFQRLDVLFLLIWIIGIYINIAVLFSSLREVLYMSAESVKAKRLFGGAVIVVSAVSAAAVGFDKLRDILMDHIYISALIILTVFIIPGTVLLSNGAGRRRKRTLKISLLIITAFTMLTLTGCGQTEIQDRLIVKGIGIDKTDDGYSAAIQYIDTSSSTDAQENKCFSVSGESLADAMGNIKNSIGLEPFLGQLSVVAAGYDTAEDMDIIADYFMRRNDVRPSVKLYLSQTTAEELLGFKKDGKIMPIDMMTSVSPELSVKSNDYTLLSYINSRIDPVQTPVATVLKCDDTIRLSTAAVFGSDGVYMLDDDEFTVYKLLQGKIEGSIISKDDISCRVEKCKERISADYNGDTLNFYSENDLLIDILENPDNKTDDEICEIIGEHMEKLSLDAADTVLGKNHDDIYGLGRRLIGFNIRDERAYVRYRELLSDCRLSVNVRCKTV